MVANQKLLDALKELNDLSSVNVKDPENEDFESARISAFDETVEEDTGVKKFGNLRKKVNDVGEFGEKYAGTKASRKTLEWSDDDDSAIEDEEDVEEDDDDDDDMETDADDTDNVSPNSQDINHVNGITDKSNEDKSGCRISGTLHMDDEVNDYENLGEAGNDEVGKKDLDTCNGAENGDDYDDDDDNDDEYDDDHDEDENVDDDDHGSDDNDTGANGDILDCSMKIDFTMIPNDLKGGPIQNSSNNVDDDIDNFAHSMMDDNVMKGQATKFQLNILDKLLESRIRLQKSLNLCNQLPQHDMMGHFREQAGPQVKESYESARTLVKELLSKLFKLQEILCETNIETSSILTGNNTNNNPDDEEIPSDTEDEEEENKDTPKQDAMENETGLNLPSKRKHTLTVTDYGEEIVKRHKAIQPFQELTIKKWHEKTRLASSVINSKNFASFDKSALQQIKQVLFDKDKLIKRTQLSRVPLKILGKENNDEIKQGGMKNEDNANLHLKDYNENIFDDGDFYHEMLKELIERKSDINADDPIAAGRRWLELQKLRTKIKRKVDTRASKGRKVRYDVHPKLVNFMAPQNVGSMSNLAKNNLFASLFDQKPNATSY